MATSKTAKLRQARLLKRGLCTSCGVERLSTKRLCEGCAAKKRVTVKKPRPSTEPKPVTREPRIFRVLRESRQICGGGYRVI